MAGNEGDCYGDLSGGLVGVEGRKVGLEFVGEVGGIVEHEGLGCVADCLLEVHAECDARDGAGALVDDIGVVGVDDGDIIGHKLVEIECKIANQGEQEDNGADF